MPSQDCVAILCIFVRLHGRIVNLCIIHKLGIPRLITLHNLEIPQIPIYMEHSHTGAVHQVLLRERDQVPSRFEVLPLERASCAERPAGAALALCHRGGRQCQTSTEQTLHKQLGCTCSVAPYTYVIQLRMQLAS